MSHSLPSECPDTKRHTQIERSRIWSPPSLLLDLAADDDTLLAELLESFRTHAFARLAHCRAALARADYSRIREEAHSIKGSARQMGAEILGDACQALESLSGFNRSLVPESLQRVEVLLEETCQAMSTYRNRAPSPQLSVLRREVE